MSVSDLVLGPQSVLRQLLRLSPIVGGVAVLLWRVRETRVPVTVPAIVVPPLGMSTGLLMFLWPPMRIPWTWAVGAVALGWAVLAWPLVRSSRLEVRDGEIYLKRTRAFLAILLGLLGVRLLLHDYVGHLVSARQTASLFYLLALGMVARWRTGMYRQFRRLTVATA